MADRNNVQNIPPEDNEMLQQTQRLLTWTAYQESLKEVDQKVLQQFQLTISSLRASLWIRVGIYSLQFIIFSIALFIGLFQVKKSPAENTLGVIISLVSLLFLVILLFRNPVLSMNRNLVDLARVQIILQGYTRQINQVDATFKQALLEKKVEIKTVSKSLEQIQKVIDGNIESLLQFMEEMRF
jgi:hypothetical protein